jgi:Arc/MetJ family transcription regulator
MGYRHKLFCIQIPNQGATVDHSKTVGPTSRGDIRRKNMNIDQAKLDRVRELLGVDTETEAVDQALSALILREELIAGVRRIAGSGGVENVFEDDVEP